MSSGNNIRFKTLVFMDLESTGATPEDFAKNVQITELCFVAIHVDRFNEKTRPPRVLNKLTICVQPKSIVSPTAIEMTGLYNGNLECQQIFSPTTALLLKTFLVHLESPICLLAHNGSNFDFRLLKSELYAHQKTLPENVFCMDTLTAAKNLIGKTYETRYIDESMDNGDSLSPILTQPPPDKEINGYGPQTQEECFGIIEKYLSENIVLPKTPVKQNRNTPYPLIPKTPHKVKKQLFLAPKRRRIIDFGQREFFAGNMKGFGLKDLYKTVMGEDMECAHEAEADVVNLLKVCHKIDAFVEYIEYNAKPFADNFFVKPLWF